MAYNDVKTHNGKSYMGMAIGGTHLWDYLHGKWKETKLTPDQWEFTFSSVKRRQKEAPKSSGCPLNTEYHWYLLADQRVKKIDKDSYETMMNGLKFKVGHKRPHWRHMSYEYPDNEPYEEQIKSILRDALKRFEDQPK